MRESKCVCVCVWESVKESIAEIERRRVVALCCTAVNRLPRCAQNAFFHVIVVAVAQRVLCGFILLLLLLFFSCIMPLAGTGGFGHLVVYSLHLWPSWAAFNFLSTVVGVCCFVVAVAVAVAAAAATTKNIFHEIALLCTQTTNRLALGT